MRLILKDSERRPDPQPVETDDRKPMIIGTACWFAALLVLSTLFEPLLAGNEGWWLWTCATGVGLGLVGILYTYRKRAN